MLNQALPKNTFWAAEETDALLQDTLSLFSYEKTGHMNAYAFNEPHPEIINDPVRGGEHWTRFIKNSQDYYLIPEEALLIEKYAEEIGNILPAGATAVDLGPGERMAVLGKTWPFITGLQCPREYVAVDVNNTFADVAARTIQSLTGIAGRAVIQNFLENNLAVEHPAIFSLFGGLLCNSPRTGLNSGLSGLSGSLKQLAQHNMKAGDYLVITQDRNQDEQNLLKAYTHPDMARYILSVLHKIKRDLPTEGFDVHNFTFTVSWNPMENLLALNARTIEKIDFAIAGHSFKLNAGEEIPLVNSYKFSEATFMKAASIAGYSTIRTFMSKQGRIALHVLQKSRQIF